MIVRNKILIDVQGEDVLMQIFTGLVMQREAGREAPFLGSFGASAPAAEPAKKKAKSVSGAAAVVGGGGGGGEGHAGAGDVASEPIRPGCGGFGIRNFLTASCPSR